MSNYDYRLNICLTVSVVCFCVQMGLGLGVAALAGLLVGFLCTWWN